MLSNMAPIPDLSGRLPNASAIAALLRYLGQPSVALSSPVILFDANIYLFAEPGEGIKLKKLVETDCSCLVSISSYKKSVPTTLGTCVPSDEHTTASCLLRNLE